MTTPAERGQVPQLNGIFREPLSVSPDVTVSGEIFPFPAKGENRPRTYEGVVDEGLRDSMTAFEPILAQLKDIHGDSLTVRRLRSEILEGVFNLHSQQTRNRIEHLGSLGIIPLFNEQYETLAHREISDDTIRAFNAFCYIQTRDFAGISWRRYGEVAAMTVQKLGTDPLKDEFHIPEVSDSPRKRKKQKQPEAYSVVGEHIFGEDTLSIDERAFMEVREEEKDSHLEDFDPFYTPEENNEDEEDDY